MHMVDMTYRHCLLTCEWKRQVLLCCKFVIDRRYCRRWWKWVAESRTKCHWTKCHRTKCHQQWNLFLFSSNVVSVCYLTV